jgi:uncharacterized YccA/Bax inhibitor family protein
MASSNPAMSADVYRRAEFFDGQTQTMTIQGAVIKTGVLLAILMITAGFTWIQATRQTAEGASALPIGLMIGGGIGGFILALVTIFKPQLSPYTAPLYAACEGLLMGGISAQYEAQFHGIVGQAIGLTLGVLVTMLGLYGTGIIRATEKFKMGVFAATGGVCLVYLVSMVASLVGHPVPYIHDAGPVGIGFSLVVVVIAALNLILDFDFIEKGAQQQAPKYMEWYGGFSLLVTLVWMYLEILRLLSKIQGNSRN